MICLRAGLIRGFVLFKSRKLQQKSPRFGGRLLIPEKYFRTYIVLLHTTLSCYIIENLILDNECNQLCFPGTLSLQDTSCHLYSPMPSPPKVCACYLWRDLRRCKYSVSHNMLQVLCNVKFLIQRPWWLPRQIWRNESAEFFPSCTEACCRDPTSTTRWRRCIGGRWQGSQEFACWSQQLLLVSSSPPPRASSSSIHIRLPWMIHQLWQKLIRSRNAVFLFESWLCRNVLVNLMGPLAFWYCRYSILQGAT